MTTPTRAARPRNASASREALLESPAVRQTFSSPFMAGLGLVT